MSDAPPTTRFLNLPDGQILCFGEYGDLSATSTVFFNHGFPGSRVQGRGFDEAARHHKIRLIAVDRPGMGQSTFQLGRRILDWPASILAVADHLNVERFAVLGLSGGGPYAFACFSQIPRQRCMGAAIVASIYPVCFGTQGMMLQNRVLLNFAPWSPWLVEKAYDFAMGTVARDNEHPERLERMVDKSFENKPEVDRASWNDSSNPARGYLADDLREALRAGSQGAAWDTYLLASDWGFKLEDLVPEPGELVIWHGALDVNVPLAMAEKARDMIEGADCRFSPSDGHLSIMANKADDMMEVLKKMFEK